MCIRDRADWIVRFWLLLNCLSHVYYLRDIHNNAGNLYLAYGSHAKDSSNNAKKDVFMELDDEIDQIWAEAVVLYRSKEKLYLSHEAEKIAKNEQSLHSESDERKGIIEAYLDRQFPDNWDSMDLYQRRDFLVDELNPKGTTPRDDVCCLVYTSRCV